MVRATAIVLGMLLLASCTRGKKKSVEPETKAPGEAAVTAAAPEAAPNQPGGPDQDWTAGVLPESMLEGAPKQGGEVVMQIWAEPPSLNTLVHSDAIAARLTDHNVYEALVALDYHDSPAHPVVPELAERWTISDDTLVYTFHLRKGVTWHDGKAFSAQDVIATFDKVTDETTKSAHMRAYIEQLAKYEALDDHTVRFTWKKPYFMTLDVFEMVPIQPAHVISKLSGSQYNEAATNPLNRHPVGTGPFRFANWEANQKITLVRNDAYWGAKAHLDRIVFRIVKDITVRKQMAQRLDVDVWTRPSDEDWVAMKDQEVFRDKFHRSMLYDSSYAWVGWNQSAKPFFADRNVRRALAMLMDRERIAEKMYYGLRKPTECHFYWASAECEGLKQLPFDQKKALQLLDEAGWKDSDGDGVRDKGGVPFRFTFMVPASSTNTAKLATKMKEDYHRAGIEMDIQKVEWAIYVKRLRKHEFDVCSLQWVSGPRSDPVQIWHSKSREGGSNYVNFNLPEADRLIEAAAVEFDGEKRTAIYREFSQLLRDEQPYMMLFVSPRKALLHTRVKGARTSLLGWRFREFWVDGERK